MTTLPTLRASEVPFNCGAGWISCFCSPDPSSLTLLCTCVNYITRLPHPPFLVAFSQLGVVALRCGTEESEVRGFILQASCQVNQDCWFVIEKQLPQDGCSHCCSLGSADCSLLHPSLRKVLAPCCYLPCGTELSFGIS